MEHYGTCSTLHSPVFRRLAKCTKGIKFEVAKRQAQIGYWDFIPVPHVVEGDPSTESLDT